jgi:hypothetical protein
MSSKVTTWCHSAIPNAIAQFCADPSDFTAIFLASPRASGTTPGS